MPNSMTAPQNPVITLVASGLAEQFSVNPLVAISRVEENSYQLSIQVYIPDGPRPHLVRDFNNIVKWNTDAGELELRVTTIDYDHPAEGTKLYSLWRIGVVYTVEGPHAEALWVRVFDPHLSDPETARGTVTSVATT